MVRIPFASQGLRLLAVLAAAALALGGCGSDPAPAKPAAGGGADTFQAPDVGTPDPAPVAQSVGAAGGAVQHSSGAKLKLPAGALPADVELTVQAATPPASVAEVGTPVGPALGPEGQTFLVPVQIGVPVDPAMTKGLDPADLQLVIAPSAGGEFVGLETTYDAASKQLIAETSHFSIVVPVKRKGPALKLTLPSPLPAAKVGTAYGPVVLQATGGKPPFSWSVAGGNLAPGVAFSPDGKLSGTPEQAGSFAASVRVKDSAGQVLEKALALTVDGPPNAKPVLDALDPASAKAGSAELAITATGKDFAIGALLTIDGKGVPTVRVSATELKAKLSAAQLASPGVLAIAAVNPPPGGGAGPSVEFAVTAADGDVVAGEDAVDAADGADGQDVADTQDVQEDTGGDAVDAGADASPACVPSAELCDGKDNDCNGQTDDNPCCTLAAGAACDDGSVCTTGEKCTDGLCLGGDVTVCVDDNLCTDNTCDPKLGCNFPANAAPCNDDKACTQGDTCQGKACAPGLSPLCDDGNACTLDQCSETAGCSHLPLDGGCDDGNGCTVGESCKDGSCGGAVAKSCDDGNGCTLDACDKATGKCSAQAVAGCGDPCKDAADCKDDGNPCTLADCATGACAVVASGGGCDDGDACTSGDACQGGLCMGASAACDDGNACTNDACGKDGKCSSSPAVGGCEDGNACTVLEACKAGACVPGGAANCEDGNACTDDSCDPKVGCQHPDSATPCTDDNPCSIGDACKGGKCTASGPKDCADSDACTADACDSQDGSCSNKPIAGCGDFCNVAGDCLGDKNPCTEWDCAAGKCAVLYPTLGCDDGSACTVEDTCAKGSCAGSTKVCDDANVCSDDSCDKASGCVFLPNAASCTDGQVCTVGDQCKDKGCVPGKAADCDDFNECTFDTCDSKLGCTYTAEGLSCSDDDPCTIGDACVGSSCVGGKAKTCDDSNACTLDVCDPQTGKCGFSAIAGCGAPCGGDGDCPAGPGPCLALSCAEGVCAASETTATCDDGSSCTAKDACTKGQCLGSSADCDDGNGCTADTCNPKTGCAHQAITGPCEDGDLCTVQDFCIEGPSCKAGLPQQCADGNPCTADACDPKKGCQFAGIQAACSDGDACTVGDACAKGECLPGDPSPCDDGNGCTADACDSAAGKCAQVLIKGCGAACQGDGDCQDDGNPCTAQVCSEGKCSVQAQSGACDDGNPCTSQDACAKSACGGSPTVCDDGKCQGSEDACDDGNACTADSCDAKAGCSSTAKAGPCDDGSACTSGDLCDKGSCKGAKLLNCDDGNPCTTDACDPGLGCASVDNKAACSDGNPCTTADQCAKGLCEPGDVKACDDGKPCTLDTCDLASGKCKSAAVIGCGGNCAEAADCQADSDPCTDAVCSEGVCALALNATACDDGNACTGGDACSKGLCIGGPKDCGDDNSCTLDSCDAKTGCVLTPISGACDDGNACTSGEACGQGKCSGGKPVSCVDANLCTDDSCDPTKGCVQLPNKVTCDDDNLCTSVDKCLQTYCVGAAEKDCDDKNPCTQDSCSTVKGCVYSDTSALCDDGNACTEGDSCAQGKCAGGKPANCDDGSTCTDDSCDLATGCTSTASSGDCEDGNACTAGDVCVFGSCLPGQPKDCNDANPCTDDACSEAKGCVNVANTAVCDDANPCTDDACDKVKGCSNVNNTKPCSDGDACTENDVCAGGTCATKPVNCDDSKVCTFDSCDAKSGCGHVELGGACSDGDACTGLDLCSGGNCQPGAPVPCDDKNPCTDDSCDKQKGCVHAANSQPCDDGDVCTLGDGCAGGACKSTGSKDCDDKNLCTDDSCDKAKGCISLANTITCTDGDACTVGDACKEGACLAGTPPDCDDKNACTDDSCDKQKGCQHANNTAACSDGDACTSADQCAAGACSGTSIACDDGNACTDDSCDKATGCKNSANSATGCTDGNACTKDDACAQGKCAGTPLVCNDNVACTVDSCAPASGCKFAPNNNLCNDNESCTTESCDAVAGCKKTTAGDNSGCSTSDPCVTTPVCLSGKCSQKPKVSIKNLTYFPTALMANGDTTWMVTENDPQGYFHVMSLDADLNTGVDWKYQGAGADARRISGDIWGGGYYDSGLIVSSVTVDGNPVHNRLRRINECCGNEPWNRQLPVPLRRIGLDTGGVAGLAQTSVTQPNQIVFFDTSGNVQHTHLLPGYGQDLVYDDQYDGTYVVCGHTLESPGSFHWKPWVAKVRRNGYLDIKWQKSLGSSFGDGKAAYACAYNGSGGAFDYIKGCTNTANTSPCDDANACTVGDTCGGKAWIGGGAKNCEDGLACTAHSCDSKTGCKQTADAKKCDDGKLCTADTCELVKGCTYAADDKVCDDGNVCTNDSCDNLKGCANLANVALCNDGNACTTADACVAGTCKGAKAVVCDDLKECTTDSCDPAVGCKVANKAGGTSCTPATSCAGTATCGGDGVCYDGPSKYYKLHLDSTKGGPWGSGSLTQVYDGSNAYLHMTHDSSGNYTAIVTRRNVYGQGEWTQNLPETMMNLVECTPWANYCFVGGRGASPGRVQANRLAASNGAIQATFTWEFGGQATALLDASFINGETDTPFFAGYRHSGEVGDAYVVRWGNGAPLWRYEGPGDDRATGLIIDTKLGNTVVGYTNSKGGGGYDGFWDDPGNSTFSGTTFGGPGDEKFYRVIHMGGGADRWAVGTGTDTPGGQPYVLLVRIAGGPQIVKKLQSLNPSGWPVGATTDGIGKIFVAAGSGIAAFDTSGNVIWQNNYPISPLSNVLMSITNHSSGLLAAGTGYNGQNGTTGLGFVRTDWDGITNCTDKNPCANLPTGGCDDKVACTLDSCDVQKGCQHTPVDAVCDDGNPCTQNLCDGIKGCLYPDATGKPCDDGKPCTVDVCDKAAAKCTSTFDPAKACGDGDLCTNELCDGNGKCAWATNDCNDGKQCTADSCDPAKGCSHAAKTGACDDGILCTVADTCEGATCKGVEVCKPPVTNGLVYTADAGLASTLIFNGSYLNWFDASVASTGTPLLPDGKYAKSLSGGGFYKPKIVANAIQGRPAVELYHTDLSFTWQNKGELTFAAVWRNQLPANLDGQVLNVGNLQLAIKQGQLMLYQSGSQTSIKVPVSSGGAYLLVVRLRSSEVKLALYGSGTTPLFASMLATPLSSGNQLVKVGTSQDQVNAELQLGAFTLYDRAVSDAEYAKLVAELRADWNFPACQSDGDCDDGNGCTVDKCEADIDGKVCTYITSIVDPGADIPCDDANPCTTKHTCKDGLCVGTATKVCDDGKVCTSDTCNTGSGVCEFTPDNGLKCNDGNACTYDVCNAGTCQGLPTGCDDNNPCTDDSCDPKSGCVNVANSAPCNDNAVCTGPDVCKDKVCSTPFNTAPCDDQNPCTVNDTCKDGDCLSGAPKVCPSDGNICTKDECSIYVGCKYTLGAGDCDDKNPCTDDTCDPVKGCLNTANAVPCSDGELCTLGDYCAAKKCNAGKLNSCEDGDICTNDSCVGGTGCKHEVVTTCEDGNLCTVDDLCVFGSCLSGGAKNCDDGNACTADYCIAPGGGCAHDALADGTPCEDGELCTLPDTCQAGSCKIGPKVCDYAVTSLADTEETDPFTGKPLPTAGTLRAALVNAENAQWALSGSGLATGTRVLRFFVGGKVTLAKPLPAVFFDKSIESGTQTVLLDGNGAVQGLYIHSGTTTLKGLKFQNFFVDKSSVSPPVWPSTSGNGGAITVMSPTNAAVPTKLILDGCEFYNAKSQYGGGAVYAVDAEVVVKGGNFVKCSRTTGTGATLPNGSIVYADGGGAVRVQGSKAKFTASDLRFDYNSGPGPGSGLWCGAGSSCVLNRVSFFGGLAHSGAVGVAAGASASLTNVTIVANEGYGIGTGLYSQGNLTLRYVTISGNSAANQQTMPALYVNGPTVMENTIVSEAGGTATGLDCVRGPKGTVTAVSSIVTKTSAMPDDWGSDGGGKACVAVTQPPANLKGQKLVGNVRVMYPYPGSPAVDKANLKACLAAPVGGVDATGAARPKGNGCDMGSAELQP